MADDIRRGFMTPEEPVQSGPVGGLASKALGGLSTFLDNVNRGVEAVMTHPLYQRAWSGLVSGATGDPLAGPFALQQMQQSALNQQWQQAQLDQMGKPTIQDELDQMRLDQMRVRRDARERLAAKLQADPRSVSDAEIYAADPDAWVKNRLAPPASAKPVQVMRDGKPVYVSAADAIGMQPVPRAPLVQNNVGGNTNATTTSLQGKQIDAQDTLARLSGIESSFNPEFQKWGSKLGQKWMTLKESAGAGLSPEEQTQLTAISAFQSNAYENMSRILNQLSGAAISPAEFERLKRFLPNVGSGVFDGDSPTEFQAKLTSFGTSVRQALKRYQYAQEHGLASGGIELPLEQFGSGDSSAREKPQGVPDGSTYDPAGHFWKSPDGRFFAED